MHIQDISNGYEGTVPAMVVGMVVVVVVVVVVGGGRVVGGSG